MPSMRKKYLLATVSMAALISGSGIATAADLAVRKAAPVAVPYVSWDGPYIGIHGGVVKHESIAYDLDTFVIFPTRDVVPVRHTGGLFGAHIGFNWQQRSLVYGLEADLSGVWHKGDDVTFTATGEENPAFQQVFSSRLRWLSTFRFRAGLDHQGTMAYVTAGVALAGIRDRWGSGLTDGDVPAFAFQFENNDVRVGWTVGGGIEHKATPNWSVRLEGLYVDLGRTTATFNGTNGTGTVLANFRTQWENTAIIARVGVTHHWDAGPVVARY
jgi:outer membrane immunogenic protein